ncbi:MAG: papain-like cysteine protease family protein [Bacteroidales bacterium]
MYRKLNFIVYITIIWITVDCYAQKIYYVGIPGSKLNYATSVQKKPLWCWAASIQMVLNYYNVAITQEQIVEQTYGKNPDGSIPNLPANLETLHRNLNNWGIDNKGKRYFVNAEFGFGPPEAILLIEELSQKRPVIIGYKGNVGHHIVVITALSYYESELGPVINTIIVRDPLPDESSCTKDGRVEFDAGTLAGRITAFWFIHVMLADF